jgi:Cu2+-exporting ATPase
VAQAIVNGGFEGFYRKRTNLSINPEAGLIQDLDLYENPEVLSRFVRAPDENTREATLTVSGINCGACLWLIESCISEQPGIESVLVNYTTRRALVRWDRSMTSLKDILGAFRGIGFDANPYEFRDNAARLQREKDQQIRRIGISGVLGMQVMMIAVALYFGRASGIAVSYERFFEWISLLLVLPIVLYCAQPFFAGAWRGVLYRQASIDIPVSLGITIAFVASVWATITGSGDTYFEAVSMFVFLLLATRYFELTARERGLDAIAHIQNRMSGTASRIGDDDSVSKIPATQLHINDVVLVGIGDSIPTDGVVVEGETRVDESIISGESKPVKKLAGNEVIGGSVNITDVVKVRVSRAHADSTISTIARFAERAQSAKPSIVRLVDRIAMGFVVGLVVVAALVAVYCWWYAPDRLVYTVISVLVIACPCALSLATPAAVSASVGALTRRGIILLKGDSLEKITQIERVVFDKTGTLTRGALALVDVGVYRGTSRDEAVSIANTLEVANPSHPVARALAKEARGADHKVAENLEYCVGGGVCGTIQDKRYCLGSPRFIGEKFSTAWDLEQPLQATDGGPDTSCILAGDQGMLACFIFSDRLRAGAKELIGEFSRAHVAVSILSGDRPPVVEHVARSLGIQDYHAQMSPQEKLDRLSRYQKGGRLVMAVGDGVNDAPLLSAAAVSVAMGSGADLARVTGDVVLVNSRLTDLSMLINQARRTRTVIMQNFVWAIGYNLLALPLGILGLVPPWAAVIGMSLSSLMVVANALRLSRNGAAPDVDGENRTDSSMAFA